MYNKPRSPKATWAIRAKPVACNPTTSPVVTQGHVERHANLCRHQPSPEQITRFRGIRRYRPLWLPQWLPRHPALFPKSQLCKPGKSISGCTVAGVPMGVPSYISRMQSPPAKDHHQRARPIIYLGATRLCAHCGFNPGCTQPPTYKLRCGPN